MLHIVFLILKIILFLILAVLGLILAAALAVLLIPVRYQAEASLHERFQAKGRVSWLFCLVSAAFSWDSGEGTGVKADVRILWFHPFKEEGQELSFGDGFAEEGFSEEDLAEESFSEEEPLPVAAQERRGGEESRHPAQGKTGQKKPRTKEARRAATLSKETNRIEETIQTEETNRTGETNWAEEKIRSEEPLRQSDAGAQEQDVLEAPTEFSVPEGGKREAGNEKKRKLPFFSRLFSWAEGAIEKGKRLFFLAASALSDIRRTAGTLMEKKEKAAAFLTDEGNQKAFFLLCRVGKRLLFSLRPRLEGSLRFGIEDPYLMGKLLTVFAALYPLYGRTLFLAPVFDENVLEGDIRARGRVRFGAFAAAGLCLLLDRNFRRLTRQLLKEGGI